MPSNNLLHSADEYAAAIKKLFPQGAYWDAQFDNPESDLSQWVKAMAEELYHFRSRFADLIAESTPKTAKNTLDDWERVLLGAVNPSLPPELRRSLLLARRRGHIDRTVLQEIAALYGAKIRRVYFPYKSAFCGHTRAGINRMCSPASFSTVFIEAEIQNPARKVDFENVIKASLLANMIVYFFYV